jgi:hypothetical protein
MQKGVTVAFGDSGVVIEGDLLVLLLLCVVEQNLNLRPHYYALNFFFSLQ